MWRGRRPLLSSSFGPVGGGRQSSVPWYCSIAECVFTAATEPHYPQGWNQYNDNNEKKQRSLLSLVPRQWHIIVMKPEVTAVFKCSHTPPAPLTHPQPHPRPPKFVHMRKTLMVNTEWKWLKHTTVPACVEQLSATLLRLPHWTDCFVLVAAFSSSFFFFLPSNPQSGVIPQPRDRHQRKKKKKKGIFFFQFSFSRFFFFSSLVSVLWL